MIRKKVETATGQNPDLVPVSKWNEYYPFPTVGALRQFIFYADKYNFKKVIRKIGNRMYIKASAFFDWVEETNKERMGE